MSEPNIPVFVEAASMSEPESTEPAAEGSTCVTDVELQTADTQKLEPIDDEPAGETVEPIAYAQEDTIEMEPAIESDEMLHSPEAEPDRLASIGVAEMNEKPSYQTAPLQSPAILQDALLDLGDFDNTTTVAVTDDLILDLEYEESAGAPAVTVVEAVPEMVVPVEAAPAESIAPEPADVAPESEYEAQPVLIAELQEWAIVAAAPVTELAPASVVEDQGPAESNLGLSPEAIDAIARRVVEHLSDAVVREIAWEVVPELADLLIKKKLEEQK